MWWQERDLGLNSVKSILNHFCTSKTLSCWKQLPPWSFYHRLGNDCWVLSKTILFTAWPQTKHFPSLCELSYGQWMMAESRGPCPGLSHELPSYLSHFPSAKCQPIKKDPQKGRLRCKRGAWVNSGAHDGRRASLRAMLNAVLLLLSSSLDFARDQEINCCIKPSTF